MILTLIVRRPRTTSPRSLRHLGAQAGRTGLGRETALDKHAHQEEMVIYPALREAGQVAEADELNGEHGYVKTYLYDLSRMSADDENWATTVREFRQLVAEHAKMEEDQVFPALKSALDEQSNDELTAEMNRDGFWQA